MALSMALSAKVDVTLIQEALAALVNEGGDGASLGSSEFFAPPKSYCLQQPPSQAVANAVETVVRAFTTLKTQLQHGVVASARALPKQVLVACAEGAARLARWELVRDVVEVFDAAGCPRNQFWVRMELVRALAHSARAPLLRASSARLASMRDAVRCCMSALDVARQANGTEEQKAQYGFLIHNISVVHARVTEPLMRDQYGGVLGGESKSSTSGDGRVEVTDSQTRIVDAMSALTRAEVAADWLMAQLVRLAQCQSACGRHDLAVKSARRAVAALAEWAAAPLSVRRQLLCIYVHIAAQQSTRAADSILHELEALEKAASTGKSSPHGGRSGSAGKHSRRASTVGKDGGRLGSSRGANVMEQAFGTLPGAKAFALLQRFRSLDTSPGGSSKGMTDDRETALMNIIRSADKGGDLLVAFEHDQEAKGASGSATVLQRSPSLERRVSSRGHKRRKSHVDARSAAEREARLRELEVSKWGGSRLNMATDWPYRAHICAEVGWLAALGGNSNLAWKCVRVVEPLRHTGLFDGWVVADYTQALLETQALAVSTDAYPCGYGSGKSVASSLSEHIECLDANAFDSGKANHFIQVHLLALKQLHLALLSAQRLKNADLIHRGAVLLWNVARPLLQPDYRSNVYRPLKDAAKALSAIRSTRYALRTHLHLEVAKCEIDAEYLQQAADHVALAMTFDAAIPINSLASATKHVVEKKLNLHEGDPGDEQSLAWFTRPLDRQLEVLWTALRINQDVYAEPQNHVERAVLCIEQARESKMKHVRRALLDRAAGELGHADESCINAQDKHIVAVGDGASDTEKRHAVMRNEERLSMSLWASIVKLAWGDGLLDMVLRASSRVLSFKWDVDIDRAMLIKQARCALLRASACKLLLEGLGFALGRLNALVPPSPMLNSSPSNGHPFSSGSDSDTDDVDFVRHEKVSRRKRAGTIVNIRRQREEEEEAERRRKEGVRMEETLLAALMRMIELSDSLKEEWILINAASFLWNSLRAVLRDQSFSSIENKTNWISQRMLDAMTSMHVALCRVHATILNVPLLTGLTFSVARCLEQQQHYDAAIEVCMRILQIVDSFAARKSIQVLARCLWKKRASDDVGSKVALSSLESLSDHIHVYECAIVELFSEWPGGPSDAARSSLVAKAFDLLVAARTAIPTGVGGRKADTFGKRAASPSKKGQRRQSVVYRGGKRVVSGGGEFEVKSDTALRKGRALRLNVECELWAVLASAALKAGNYSIAAVSAYQALVPLRCVFDGLKEGSDGDTAADSFVIKLFPQQPPAHANVFGVDSKHAVESDEVQRNAIVSELSAASVTSSRWRWYAVAQAVLGQVVCSRIDPVRQEAAMQDRIRWVAVRNFVAAVDFVTRACKLAQSNTCSADVDFGVALDYGGFASLAVRFAQLLWNSVTPFTGSHVTRRLLAVPLRKVVHDVDFILVAHHAECQADVKRWGGEGLLDSKQQQAPTLVSALSQTQEGFKRQVTITLCNSLNPEFRCGLYSLLCDCLQDARQWKCGLDITSSALRFLPPSLHKEIWKRRVLFMASLGMDAVTGAQQLVHLAPHVASEVWLSLARSSSERLEQFNYFAKAIAALENPLERVPVLIEYGSWLHGNGFPVSDAQDQLFLAADILHDIEPDTLEREDEQRSITALAVGSQFASTMTSVAGGGNDERRTTKSHLSQGSRVSAFSHFKQNGHVAVKRLQTENSSLRRSVAPGSTRMSTISRVRDESVAKSVNSRGSVNTQTKTSLLRGASVKVPKKLNVAHLCLLVRVYAVLSKMAPSVSEAAQYGLVAQHFVMRIWSTSIARAIKCAERCVKQRESSATKFVGGDGVGPAEGSGGDGGADIAALRLMKVPDTIFEWVSFEPSGLLRAFFRSDQSRSLMTVNVRSITSPVSLVQDLWNTVDVLIHFGFLLHCFPLLSLVRLVADDIMEQPSIIRLVHLRAAALLNELNLPEDSTRHMLAAEPVMPSDDELSEMLDAVTQREHLNALLLQGNDFADGRNDDEARSAVSARPSWSLGFVWCKTAALLVRVGRISEAKTLLVYASRFATAFEEEAVRAECLRVASSIAKLAGQPEAAVRLVTDAQELAGNVGAPVNFWFESIGELVDYIALLPSFRKGKNMSPGDVVSRNALRSNTKSISLGKYGSLRDQLAVLQHGISVFSANSFSKLAMSSSGTVANLSIEAQRSASLLKMRMCLLSLSISLQLAKDARPSCLLAPSVVPMTRVPFSGLVIRDGRYNIGTDTASPMMFDDGLHYNMTVSALSQAAGETVDGVLRRDIMASIDCERRKIRSAYEEAFSVLKEVTATLEAMEDLPNLVCCMRVAARLRVQCSIALQEARREPDKRLKRLSAYPLDTRWPDADMDEAIKLLLAAEKHATNWLFNVRPASANPLVVFPAQVALLHVKLELSAVHLQVFALQTPLRCATARAASQTVDAETAAIIAAGDLGRMSAAEAARLKRDWDDATNLAFFRKYEDIFGKEKTLRQVSVAERALSDAVSALNLNGYAGLQMSCKLHVGRSLLSVWRQRAEQVDDDSAWERVRSSTGPDDVSGNGIVRPGVGDRWSVAHLQTLRRLRAQAFEQAAKERRAAQDEKKGRNRRRRSAVPPSVPPQVTSPPVNAGVSENGILDPPMMEKSLLKTFSSGCDHLIDIVNSVWSHTDCSDILYVRNVGDAAFALANAIGTVQPMRTAMYLSLAIDAEVCMYAMGLAQAAAPCDVPEALLFERAALLREAAPSRRLEQIDKVEECLQRVSPLARNACMLLPGVIRDNMTLGIVDSDVLSTTAFPSPWSQARSSLNLTSSPDVDGEFALGKDGVPTPAPTYWHAYSEFLRMLPSNATLVTLWYDQARHSIYVSAVVARPLPEDEEPASAFHECLAGRYVLPISVEKELHALFRKCGAHKASLRRNVLLYGSQAASRQLDMCESAFDDLIAEVNAILRPCWDSCGGDADFSATVTGRDVIVISDALLFSLPLESLYVFGGARSVAREFSVAMLSKRLSSKLLEVVHCGERHRGGGVGTSSGKSSSSSSRAVDDTAAFIVDPLYEDHLASGEDVFDDLLKTKSNTHNISSLVQDDRWITVAGTSSYTPVAGEMERLVAGNRRVFMACCAPLFSILSPARIASFSLEDTALMLLCDKAVTEASYRRYTKHLFQIGGDERALETPYNTALLLSVRGVRGIVLNQFASSAAANSAALLAVSKPVLGTGGGSVDAPVAIACALWRRAVLVSIKSLRESVVGDGGEGKGDGDRKRRHPQRQQARKAVVKRQRSVGSGRAGASPPGQKNSLLARLARREEKHPRVRLSALASAARVACAGTGAARGGPAPPISKGRHTAKSSHKSSEARARKRIRGKHDLGTYGEHAVDEKAVAGWGDVVSTAVASFCKDGEDENQQQAAQRRLQFRSYDAYNMIAVGAVFLTP